VAGTNRDPGAPGAPDDWAWNQCGNCRFWIPLTGAWGLDWGACSNPDAPFDAQVRFEHDGCGHHQPAGKWVTPDEGDARA